MTVNSQTTTPVRRVFVYGQHRFDDPGSEYTVEQVKNHLLTYFPELAHATTEEKTLPDGIVEITFRKQVARKGTGDAGRLALLLNDLEAVPPYKDLLAELTATLGREPLSLAAILDARETLRENAGQVFAPLDRTSRVVERCVRLPPLSMVCLLDSRSDLVVLLGSGRRGIVEEHLVTVEKDVKYVKYVKYVINTR